MTASQTGALQSQPSPQQAKKLDESTSTGVDYVKIGDWEYDITAFQKRHPGGSVIRYLLLQNGADATETYREFHYRSKKADKMLASLPKRPATHQFRKVTKAEKEMLEDFAKLRQQLVDEGYFTPSIPHVIFRLGELLAMFALGVYLISIGYTVASVIVFGLFGARCGWVQHEGGHSSLTGNIKLDKLIQKATIGFGLATGGGLWNAMHNKHHSVAQKVNHDIDLDTIPLVAFFKEAFETNSKHKSSGPASFLGKLWMRYQAYTFLPITSGIFVMIFWMYFLHPRKVIRDMDVVQGLFMLSSHIIRTQVYMTFGGFSLGQAYALFFLCQVVSGMYLFGHFSLSHTFTPVVEENDNPNWLQYAFEHTVDITPENPIVNWIMGYLNCQVVHHLFPNMPQFRQPVVSKMLIPFAKKHNLKYEIMGYFDAWGAMFSNLDEVGKHYYEGGSGTKEE